MAKYVDPNSYAENSGNIPLSKDKIAYIRDNIFSLSFFKKMHFNKQIQRINEYLTSGDIQPALVVSTSPLIISAYSDEMDAVVFLKFPDELAKMYNLHEGMRLTTANVYRPIPPMAADITIGAEYLNRYFNYTPIVRLFLCDNERYLLSQESLFDEHMWQRVEIMTSNKQHEKTAPRDGFYYFFD